jgi:hypothetical protein
MNLFLVGSALLTGTAGLAMQNEQVAETVTETASQVRTMIQNRFKSGSVDQVRENGFAYPSEEYLATLTEEQSFAIVSAIDVINATYDWQNMTDEEITLALQEVKAELHALYEELGIDGPMVQTQTRTQTRKGKGGANAVRTQSQLGDQDGDCNLEEPVNTDSE